MDDLFPFAYKKERAAGRRLARETGVQPAAALRKILENSAGPQSVEDLMAQRKHEHVRVAQRIAERRQRKSALRAAKSQQQTPDPTAWLAWFDGATHPNPGRMGIGGVLQNPHGAKMEISFCAGHGDSSEAEYRAMIAVLQVAVSAGAHKLVLHGDSRVVIDDVGAAIGAVALTAWRHTARELIAQLSDVTLRWIPRRKNALADALSQQAVRRSA